MQSLWINMFSHLCAEIFMEGGVGQVWDPYAVVRLRLTDQLEELHLIPKGHFFKGERPGWLAVLQEQAQSRFPLCP